jgi:hypothetical protein
VFKLEGHEASVRRIVLAEADELLYRYLHFDVLPCFRMLLIVLVVVGIVVPMIERFVFGIVLLANR